MSNEYNPLFLIHAIARIHSVSSSINVFAVGYVTKGTRSCWLVAVLSVEVSGGRDLGLLLCFWIGLTARTGCSPLDRPTATDSKSGKKRETEFSDYPRKGGGKRGEEEGAEKRQFRAWADGDAENGSTDCDARVVGAHVAAGPDRHFARPLPPSLPLALSLSSLARQGRSG